MEHLISICYGDDQRVELLGEIIKSQYKFENPIIITSPLTWCKKSAEIIGTVLGIESLSTLEAKWYGNEKEAERTLMYLNISCKQRNADAVIFISEQKEVYYTACKAAEMWLRNTSRFTGFDEYRPENTYVVNQKEVIIIQQQGSP